MGSSLHANLTTESRNPASERLDALSALEIVRLMNAEDSSVAPAVGQRAEAIAAAIDEIADRLRGGGRLVYIGAGTSGRLGVLDATECPPTFSSPPDQVIGLIAGGPAALTRAIEGAEDRGESAVEDLQTVGLGSRDVVVGIATSGRTPYVVAGLEFARHAGAFTIALSCNDNSSIAGLADVAITPVVGAEVLSGSTRLKAGTATKLVLNMLTTGAMVRIGKTYGNLMVDLKATNNKLRDRTRRIVKDLTGLDERDAQELLNRCGGELKTAVVAHERNTSPEEARRLLDAAGQQLRGALACKTPGPSNYSGCVAPERGLASDFVLGIDVGGTSTTAVLARLMPGRDPEPIGRGTAGGANPLTIEWSYASAELIRAIDGAFRSAGWTLCVPIGAVCIAAAGAGRPEQEGHLREWAQNRRLANQVIVVHDAEPVLAAGSPKGWGVAVIAGTGSFVFGRNPDGATARAGGWGPLLGDEGSAYAIAVEALRAIAQDADGCGPRT
ncbi:MAG: N-acetylmuramic acid 6-phosphate etherase, partial [Planctomycetes bacterium]|nr:N-acetylmuramic acid 6-phosphate etherase [Planctomycetota bacterium]